MVINIVFPSQSTNAVIFIKVACKHKKSVMQAQYNHSLSAERYMVLQSFLPCPIADFTQKQPASDIMKNPYTQDHHWTARLDNFHIIFIEEIQTGKEDNRLAISRYG